MRGLANARKAKQVQDNQFCVGIFGRAGNWDRCRHDGVVYTPAGPMPIDQLTVCSCRLPAIKVGADSRLFRLLTKFKEAQLIQQHNSVGCGPSQTRARYGHRCGCT
jgi:hypothetical protein